MPAALVGVLAGLGVPDGDVFASVVALAIVLTLLLQALPARWLAGRLGLLEPANAAGCAEAGSRLSGSEELQVAVDLPLRHLVVPLLELLLLRCFTK